MKKRIIIALILLMTFISGKIMPVEAVSGKISVYCSATKPVVGNRVTFKITASCSDGVGGGLIQLVYDTNYMTLVSHNAGANYNKNNRKLMIEPTSETSETYTFVFETKKTGKTSMTVTTLEFRDFKMGEPVTGYNESISFDITIQAKTSNNPDTTPLSADNSLASLLVENFSFEEEFSSSRYEYTMYVPNGTEKLNITAKASSGKARVKEFDSSLQEGWNKIEITCVAENKSECTYIINVYVEESPKVFFDYKGKKLGAVVNLSRIELEGFIKNELETLTEFVNEGYELLYLIDEEGIANFYHYDPKENKILGLYQPVIIENRMYVLTDVNYEDFPEMSPEDFYQTRIEIDSLVLDGWKYNAANMKDMVIIYLRDENGIARLYQYDTMERTIQRFIQPQKPEPEPEPMFDQKDYIIMGTSAGISLISIIMAMVMKAKNRKLKKQISN
ncbi:MAG: cadherin-like beta sandwich domain-containing protein [Erysipelotrichaceae bacterium]|nr:cadherin-like beta sandwich domain-containing protein [Erysipelotrichaceae bacterium]